MNRSARYGTVWRWSRVMQVVSDKVAICPIEPCRPDECSGHATAEGAEAHHLLASNAIRSGEVLPFPSDPILPHGY